MSDDDKSESSFCAIDTVPITLSWNNPLIYVPKDAPALSFFATGEEPTDALGVFVVEMLTLLGFDVPGEYDSKDVLARLREVTNG